jgi:subtilisin
VTPTLPAWSEAFAAGSRAALTREAPLGRLDRQAVFGDADGRGVTVAIVDSGVDGHHPSVRGRLTRHLSVEVDGGEAQVVEDPNGVDLVGHGTACAGIIRSLAPEAHLYSVRVLGSNLKGRGSLFIAGIRWAIDAGMDVVNLSLSTGREQWFGPLHDLADEAYFHNVLLVCAANNVPGPTYPSQYASVVSVAAREGADPYAIAYNPRPPVEFGASGIDVDVAWNDGTSIVATGNSFATPHVAGLVARLLSKHPGLTPFQVKSVLQAVAVNAR